MCVCLVCVALSKAPASSRPPGHNGLQLPPSPPTRAAARALAREPFLARAWTRRRTKQAKQNICCSEAAIEMKLLFPPSNDKVFRCAKAPPPQHYCVLPPPPPHPFPISEAFDSVLLLNSSWNSSISKSSSSPSVLLLLLLLPRRSAGQVWERDCPSEVGCYQQGGCMSPIQVSLGYRRGLKSEPQRFL